MSSSPKAISRIRQVGRPAEGHQGFTLVELMVAMAVGLFLVGGLLAIYLNASRTNNEMAKMNHQMENGRFALQLLREDLWHAGYWGELSPTNAPTAIPDPCQAFGAAWTSAYKANLLAIPVQGYDNGIGLPTDCSMVTDRETDTDTDVLVVRHASTCIAGTANCESYNANKLYLQVSLCSSDMQPYVMDTDSTTFVLRKRDSTGKSCTATGYSPTLADKRKVISHIYYIRNYSVTSGDNIPTLMRSELDLSGSVVAHQTSEALVEGIEHLEVEYGLDDDNDGSADRFVSAPATAAEWGNVVAVEVHVLARNIDPTPGYKDTKTYQLGSVTVGPFNNPFKRHVYSTYVRLNNPAGRRDRP